MIATLASSCLAFAFDPRLVYRCDGCGKEAAAPPGYYPQGWRQGIGCFDWCARCVKKMEKRA